MLSHAVEAYPKVQLVPIPIVSTGKGDSTWRNSLTKFNAFRLTNYSRVMYFDSDSLVPNKMDHYFLAPLSRLAIPRAYWLGNDGQSVAEQTMCSHVMLLQPDEYSYKTIMDEATRSGDFDMEVINHLFNNSAMILPHRRLALLSCEFRAKDHHKYLSDEPDADWNAMGEILRSVLVHFSNWPLPKPWMHRTDAQWTAALPECDPNEVPRDDRPVCADRVMWSGLYEQYDELRAKICKDF